MSLSRIKLHAGFLAFSVVVAAFLTLPVIGFVYGCVSVKGAGNGVASIVPRVFIGIVCAICTTFEGGFMPDNEGGTSYTDLRHYIVPAFFSLSALIYGGILVLLGIDRLIHRIDPKY